MKQKYDINWVIAQKNPTFLFFWGHTPRKDGVINQSCFSQWYDHSFDKEQYFPTNEHWMMYHKAMLFKDEATAKKISNCKLPNDAKRLGREVKNFDNNIWDANKYRIVYEGNIEKFKDKELQKYLLSTGNKILVEASPYDTIWGIGLHKDGPNAMKPNKWKGLNLLGFVLMEVRDYYRAII